MPPIVHLQIQAMQANSILAAQQIVQRTIPALERQLDDALAAKPPTLDLVLSQVQVIDSFGLNWLLAMQTRLESMGTQLRLLDPSPIVHDILIATRLDSRLPIKSSADLVQGGPHGRH